MLAWSGRFSVRILDERREALVDRERALLERLVGFLKDFGAPTEDVELVRRALSDLEELFLLVIVGEFNSGKSAFVNALLGAEISEEGVTPTTDRITVLRHADEPVERERRDGVLEKGYPNEFLREIAIVDTPGTNAIIRHHEELSRGFVPRSDLVLFVTSAERPLTESERGYLELIRGWGKKILLVINKSDLLGDEFKVEQVRSFVSDGIRSALGLTPPLFFVSALLARKAKAATSVMERDALLGASGFADLEGYVTDLLDEEGRVRLKLESPLGVVEELNRRYRGAVDERLSLLEDDFRTSENVESQLELYKEDMKRDFEARLAEIENIVLRMSERGDAWLEDNIGSPTSASSSGRRGSRALRAGGSRRHRGPHRRAGGRAHRLDGGPQPQAVARDSRVRQPPPSGRVRRADDRGGRRRLRVQPRPAPAVRRQERPERRAALRQGARVRDAGDLDPGRRRPDRGPGGRGRGHRGRRGGPRHTRFVDATGIIAAAIVAGYGLFILPNRRRKARDEFREKTDSLRERLGEVVRRQFDAELSRSVERMREAIAPYTRFVRTEHARMSRAGEDLATLDAETNALKEEISAPSV
jgi:small GTP-binding protein